MELPKGFYKLLNVPNVGSINRIINPAAYGLPPIDPPIDIWICDGTKCEKAKAAEGGVGGVGGYFGIYFKFDDNTLLDGFAALSNPSSEKPKPASAYASHPPPPGFYIHEDNFEKVKTLLPKPPDVFNKKGLPIELNKISKGGKRKSKRTIRKRHSRKRKHTSKYR
jgi:hypothetical protein